MDRDDEGARRLFLVFPVRDPRADRSCCRGRDLEEQSQRLSFAFALESVLERAVAKRIGAVQLSEELAVLVSLADQIVKHDSDVVLAREG